MSRLHHTGDRKTKLGLLFKIKRLQSSSAAETCTTQHQEKEIDVCVKWLLRHVCTPLITYTGAVPWGMTDWLEGCANLCSLLEPMWQPGSIRGRRGHSSYIRSQEVAIRGSFYIGVIRPWLAMLASASLCVSGAAYTSNSTRSKVCASNIKRLLPQFFPIGNIFQQK